MTSRWRVRGTEDRASCLVTCWLVSRVSRHVLSGSENTWLLGTPGPGHVARYYDAVTVARVTAAVEDVGSRRGGGGQGHLGPVAGGGGRHAARGVAQLPRPGTREARVLILRHVAAVQVADSGAAGCRGDVVTKIFLHLYHIFSWLIRPTSSCCQCPRPGAASPRCGRVSAWSPGWWRPCSPARAPPAQGHL